jgi:FkbM family methyltransferase
LSLYERLASTLIGTPLQRPAEWLRHAKGAVYRRRHPELGEIFLENERIDRTMRVTIGPATHCIDVGSHVGAYLQKIVTLAPHGRHLAVEPVAHKAAWLRAKFPQVTVLEAALDETEGVKQFFLDPVRTSLSGLGADPSGGRRPIAVHSRVLDDVVDPGTSIGFVKIDVNGGELRVLRGARRLLRRNRPFVLLECTKRGLDEHGVGADDMFNFLVGEVGYRIYLLKDHLAGGEPLDAGRFRASMVYPFQAFNYAVVAGP